MGLLLLDRAQLEVRSEGETLALYEAGERRGTVPIKLIDRCVIHGAQTRLDTGVLMKLAEAGVTTTLMSTRQTRRVALVLGPRHNDATVRLAQASRVMDEAFCRQWAQTLVRAKLQRQRRMLEQLRAQRLDCRKPLSDALHTLHAIACSLDTPESDGAAPALASVRGLEGAAAHAYYAALVHVMPPVLGFTGRNRRPPRDPVNVCLSLGYTLLHHHAVVACNAAGLDPLLGFYHRPAFGRESLACDFIEPLRPSVDLWAWELLRSRTLNADHFTQDKGACFLGKAGRSIYYNAWEGASKPWRRWLRAQCQPLAAALRHQGQASLEENALLEDTPWD